MSIPRIDRLPPHSIESEQGVLGCVMLDPKESMSLCLTKLKGGADTFYDLRHQHIFGILSEMYDATEAIDIITVHQKLKDRNQLEAIGGVAYLSSLTDSVPSAANLDYYLDIVREKYLLRRMIQTCTGAVGRVYEHEGEVEDLLDGIEREVLQIGEDRATVSEVTIKDLIRGAVSKIEEYHQRQGALSGIGSGFPDLDKMTGGFQDGDMIVIAARPSMGKTSLAMNIAEHVALESKLTVGVFSLERTKEALALRLLLSRSRVSIRNVKDGFLTEGDFPKITGAASKLAKADLHIDDEGGMSILQLRAKARRMKQRFGIKLFVIDYLQLVHSTSRKAETRQQEVADVSNGIKAIAKELSVPVIVLAQLSREMEKDKNRKPRLSDLKESGAIEQDADLVGLLYKPPTEDDDEAHGESTPVNLLIAKQRNGPTGDVPLTFIKPYTRFESAAKVLPQ